MLVKKSALLDLLDALGVDTARQWPDEKLAAKINELPGIVRFRSDGHQFADDFLAQSYHEIKAANDNAETVEVEDDVPKDAKTTPEVRANGKPPSVGKKESPSVGEKTPPKKVVKKATAEKSKKPAQASSNGKPKPKKVAAKKIVKKTQNPAKPARTTPALYEGMTWANYVRYLKKNPKKLDLSKPGVMVATYKLLHAAGKKKPKGITKEEMHETLIRMFPQNTRKGLWTNISNNVPSRFMWMYQIEVQSKTNSGRHKVYWIEGTPASVVTGVKEPTKRKSAKAKAKAGK